MTLCSRSFQGSSKCIGWSHICIREITDGGAVQLATLNGELFLGKVNGSRLKLYRSDPALAQ